MAGSARFPRLLQPARRSTRQSLELRRSLRIRLVDGIDVPAHASRREPGCRRHIGLRRGPGAPSAGEGERGTEIIVEFLADKSDIPCLSVSLVQVGQGFVALRKQ